MIVTQISIELSGINRFEYVIAKQGDVNSRLLQVQLLNNGKVYVLDDQTTARVSITKPDEEEVLQDCTINNNRVEILLDANILAAAGTAETEIVLTGSGGHVLTSATFDIVIVATNTGKNAESSSDYKSFKNALAKVDGLKNEIAVERARINQFTKLPNGSTTGDAELQDIRVGADGKTYGTAGEAVRSQLGKINTTLDW